MQRLLIFLLVLFVTLTACKQSAKQISPYLTIVEDESGENIKVDDFLSITYTEKTEEGKLVSSTADYDDRPKLMFRESSYFKDDFFSMLGSLSEGDSAQFKINIDSIIQKKGTPIRVNTTGKYLVYNVRINKVIARGDLNDSLYNAAIEEHRKEVIEKERGREQGKLDQYISKNNLKPIATASGLQYILTKTGTGSKAKLNDTVVVNYIGKTLAGKVFETTYESIAKREGLFNKEIPYIPARIPITSEANSGFMEAMASFPKGTKATLIIPSKLAYAGGNYKMIQPYTPLVCEFEILDIVSPRK